MKTICLFLSGILLFTSCTRESSLDQLIQETNLVKVFIVSNDNIPVVHYETNDIDKIKMWKNYIDENSTGASNCNYEGKLVFRVYDDSTIMQFSLQNECEQVSYILNDSLFVKKFTPEGISFLNSLKQTQ